jgi:hypothetical protein
MSEKPGYFIEHSFDPWGRHIPLHTVMLNGHRPRQHEPPDEYLPAIITMPAKTPDPVCEQTDPQPTGPQPGQLPEMHAQANRRGAKVAAAMLAGLGFLAGLSIGGNFGYTFGRDTASAREMNKELNEGDYVAERVVVEVGSDLALNDSPIPGAVMIANPIRFGKDTYGYIDPIPESGEVRVKTIETKQPLVKSVDGHSHTYQHQVTTDVALVYSEYTNAVGRPVKLHWVTMGNKSGSIYELIDTTVTPKNPNLNEIVTRQFTEMSDAGVGQVVFANQ